MPDATTTPAQSTPDRAAAIRAHLGRLNDYELVGWYDKVEKPKMGPRNPPFSHEKMQG